jgi:hypothetical protein
LAVTPEKEEKKRSSHASQPPRRKMRREAKKSHGQRGDSKKSFVITHSPENAAGSKKIKRMKQNAGCWDV